LPTFGVHIKRNGRIKTAGTTLPSKAGSATLRRLQFAYVWKPGILRRANAKWVVCSKTSTSGSGPDPRGGGPSFTGPCQSFLL